MPTKVNCNKALSVGDRICRIKIAVKQQHMGGAVLCGEGENDGAINLVS